MQPKKNEKCANCPVTTHARREQNGIFLEDGLPTPHMLLKKKENISESMDLLMLPTCPVAEPELKSRAGKFHKLMLHLAKCYCLPACTCAMNKRSQQVRRKMRCRVCLDRCKVGVKFMYHFSLLFGKIYSIMD
jgi:hypothetical protein